MKRLIIALSLFLPATALAENVTITVKGMVCSFCAQGIKKTFRKEPAVETVNVDLEHKIVSLKLKADATIADEKLESLITDAGYNVEKIERKSDE